MNNFIWFNYIIGFFQKINIVNHFSTRSVNLLMYSSLNYAFYSVTQSKYVHFHNF
jgi:hypothetical protein